MAEGPRAAILIGSGPSLRLVDVAAFRTFPTISFNRSWLAWDEWGFDPTWYACLDGESINLLEPELSRQMQRRAVRQWFLHSKSRLEGPNVTKVAVDAPTPAASLHRICDLGNAGASTLQLLAGMQLRRVLLVGVDARYETASVGADVNHFRPDYALRPVSAADADSMARYVAGWPAAAQACRDWGMEVRNASPGTALTAFPVVSPDEGLTWITDQS